MLGHIGMQKWQNIDQSFPARVMAYGAMMMVTVVIEMGVAMVVVGVMKVVVDGGDDGDGDGGRW